jgi:hypothetical protein
LKKTGSFRKSGGNPRRPQNRQGNGHGKNQNQSQNTGQRKDGIHPWVSSGPSSSQALTSHIRIANKNTSGSNNNRKPQNSKNPYRHKRNNGGNQSGEKLSYQERVGRGNGKVTPTSHQSVGNFAEKKSSVSDKSLTGGMDAFSLFCAYHLGIGPKKEYKPSNLNEVARRFGNDPATVRQALKECNMDSAALLDRDFDMALAQLDIQVAPEGIDRMELARSIYDDFLAAPHVKRDWKKILEEDRKENRKIFGG